MKHIFGKVMKNNKNESKEEFSICMDLKKEFDNNAAGIKGMAKYDNLLPLVQFAREQEKRYGEPPCEEKTGYLEEKLELFGRELCAMRKKKAEIMNPDGSVDAKARELIGKLKKDEDISETILRIYDYLLENWELVKGYQVTYKVLFGLTVIRGNWKSSSSDRKAYDKILRFVKDEQKSMGFVWVRNDEDENH